MCDYVQYFAQQLNDREKAVANEIVYGNAKQKVIYFKTDYKHLSLPRLLFLAILNMA